MAHIKWLKSCYLYIIKESCRKRCLKGKVSMEYGLPLYERPKERLFEIPNCFDGWVSNMEIPEHKNHIRIMTENYY